MTVNFSKISDKFSAQPQLKENGHCRLGDVVHKLRYVTVVGRWITFCGQETHEHHYVDADDRATDEPLDCMRCIARDGTDQW